MKIRQFVLTLILGTTYFNVLIKGAASQSPKQNRRYHQLQGSIFSLGIPQP